MKAIAFPSSIQAAAFLDGIQYVNDGALTPLGINQYPNGTAEALLQDTDDAEDDSSRMTVPVSDRDLSHSCSIAQLPSADGESVLLTRTDRIRAAFERGYQTVLGESQAQPRTRDAPFSMRARLRPGANWWKVVDATRSTAATNTGSSSWSNGCWPHISCEARAYLNGRALVRRAAATRL